MSLLSDVIHPRSSSGGRTGRTTTLFVPSHHSSLPYLVSVCLIMLKMSQSYLRSRLQIEGAHFGVLQQSIGYWWHHKLASGSPNQDGWFIPLELANPRDQPLLSISWIHQFQLFNVVFPDFRMGNTCLYLATLEKKRNCFHHGIITSEKTSKDGQRRGSK